jgi:hypothetical protein
MSLSRASTREPSPAGPGTCGLDIGAEVDGRIDTCQFLDPLILAPGLGSGNWRLVDLAFLSPRLVEAILQGRQSVELTVTRLTELDLPLDWPSNTPCSQAEPIA